MDSIVSMWGLAAAAFAGATLMPFSSEAAVLAALAAGASSDAVFLSASLGNLLGASVNYGLGVLFSGRVRRSLRARRSGRRALLGIERYGAWSLLGSWLPVVGDPLCLGAGLVRLSPVAFILLGLGTRVARYWVLVYVLGG